MDAFVVAGEVEGNAAEINKAKKSDVFINAISADMLGTIPGGNVGEFLKYVPGLLVDYGAFPEAETVSMRGQDADATQFTFDGMPQASAGRVPRAADESTTGMNFNDMTIDNIEAGSDMASLLGSYSAIVREPGATPQRLGGRFLFVFRRQVDGSWKISRGVGTDPEPPK